MEKQLIISIGREYGSGGHEIAEKLSKIFNINFYDRNILEEIAMHKEVDVNELHKYDELPKKKLLSRNVRGYSNSPEEIVANMQFDFLRKKADSGESFVIVGRCAESILREYKGLVSIFVTGDRDCRIERVMKIKNLDNSEAIKKMDRHNKLRKAYHDHFSVGRWRESKTYNITINSSKLGIEGTVDVLEYYIRQRIK